METALVTGAAGFIGSTLVRELLDRGYTVRGLDDLSSGRRENLEVVSGHEAFEFVEADVVDPAAVDRAIAGVDAVFHQAAGVSVPRSIEDPRSTTETNCLGTATLLDAARDAGVDTVVVASSAAVYGSSPELPTGEASAVSPESPYALSKYYTEELSLQVGEHHDLDAVALRYFNVYGPRQDPGSEYSAVVPTFIRRMLDGEPPVIHGDGGQSRDFVHVDDVVEANVIAAEGAVSGEVFNVARGERVTVNELVAVLNEVLGTDLDPVHDEPRPGDVRHSQADVSKIMASLGYEPTVGFQEGLERTVEWFR